MKSLLLQSLTRLLILCFSYYCVSQQFQQSSHQPDSFAAVIVFSGYGAQGANVGALLHTLKLFHDRLDARWKIQIFYDRDVEPIKTGISENLGRFVSPSRFVFTNFARTNSIDSFSNAMLSNASFWKSIVGEKILFFQIDSGLCSNFTFPLDYFLKYDYVGAPWKYRHIKPGNGNDMPDYEIKPSEDETEFLGGNGGFSLRSRTSMLACAEALQKGLLNYPPNLIRNEDARFGYCVKNYLKNQVLPTRKVSLAFSTESVYRPSIWSVGFHKPWQYLHYHWDRFKKHCPEAEAAMKRFQQLKTQ